MERAELVELFGVLKGAADKWKQLGVQLNFQVSELNVIETNTPGDMERQLLELIKRWLQRTGSNRSERKAILLEALNHVDENVLSRDIGSSDYYSLSSEPKEFLLRSISMGNSSSIEDDVFSRPDEEVRAALVEYDRRFIRLQRSLCTELRTQFVVVEEFVNTLEFLPISIKEEYEDYIDKNADLLEDLKSTKHIMRHLDKYWNFFDYGLLEFIIEEYGSDDLKQDMQLYANDLRKFRKSTTVRQFIRCWPGHTDIPPRFELMEITINVDIEWNLEKLEQMRKDMYRQTHLTVFAFIVHKLQEGCIVVVWAVPRECLSAIIGCVLGGSFITEPKILNIKIDGVVVDKKMLLEVCSQGKTELVRALLESGVNPNHEVTEKGQTPLMIVCKFLGRLDIVELLLDHNADVNLHSTNNVTPLGYASYEGYTDIVELLLKEGADVNALNQVGGTALSNASSDGHVDTVRVLLQHGAGATIDLRNQRGATPLHYAAQGGHLEVAKLLLGKGASIEETNRPGGTALSIAIAAGHIDVANLLLSRGANVNTETGDNNQTPLMFATMIGDMEMVRLILKYDPEINARSKNGITALMLAVQGCHDDIVNTLLEQGADPNLAEKETGWSPLHVAVKHAHFNVARMLFEHKAQPDVNDLSLAFDVMQVLLSDSNSRAMSEVFEKFGFERDKHHKISEVSINEIHNQDETLHKVFTQHETELHIQEEPKNQFLFPERYVLSVGVGVPQQTTGIDSVDFQEEFKDSTLVPTRTKDYPHSGIFGYIERLIVNGEICVGRKYQSDLLDYQDKKRLRDAIRRLEKLSHENIAKMKGVCFYDELTYPVIITEILDTTLDRKNLEKTSLEMRLSILNKVAKGLAYLHKEDVTHYSLTAQNVRVTESLDIVKIGGIDDGLIVDRKKLLAHNQDTKSIAMYMPPEVSNPKLIYTQFDVFSFGHLAMCTVIGEFSTGTEILFPAEHVTAQEHHVEGMTEVERRQGYVSRLDDILESGDYRSVGDLIKQCLRDEPRKRPKTQLLQQKLASKK